MRHHLEVQTSLNALYDSIYGESEGEAPLRVQPPVKGQFRVFLSQGAEEISSEILDQYMDGSLKDSASAKKEVVRVFRKLRREYSFFCKLFHRLSCPHYQNQDFQIARNMASKVNVPGEIFQKVIDLCVMCDKFEPETKPKR